MIFFISVSYFWTGLRFHQQGIVKRVSSPPASDRSYRAQREETITGGSDMEQLVTISNDRETGPAPAPVKHYRAYRPRSFTRAERETTTLLFGGTTWKHERLIQAVLQNADYNAEPLPNISRETLMPGRS